jgi:hypothetical protein
MLIQGAVEQIHEFARCSNGFIRYCHEVFKSIYNISVLCTSIQKGYFFL